LVRHDGSRDQTGSDGNDANEKGRQFPDTWAKRRGAGVFENTASADVANSTVIGLELLAAPAKLGHVGLSRL
jgi:hypothetical protein